VESRDYRGRILEGTCQGPLEKGKERGERRTMAAMVAACSGLGRKKLTHYVTAAVCLPDRGTRAGEVSIVALRSLPWL
jgi:hypothetical protein